MSARRRYKRQDSEKAGNLFFTLSVLAFIAGIFPILSSIATVIYFVVMGIIIVGTLGLIMLNDSFKEGLNSGERLFKDLHSLIVYSPYVLFAAAALGLISTIIYARSTKLRKKGGNVTAGIIFTILPIIVAIFVMKQ